MFVEGCEFGVVLDGVEGGVVAVVALVFPYVDLNCVNKLAYFSG